MLAASLAEDITSSHEQLFLATRPCRAVLFQTVQRTSLNLVANHDATKPKTKRNHCLPLHHTVIGIPISGRHQAAKASKDEKPAGTLAGRIGQHNKSSQHGNKRKLGAWVKI